MISMRKMLTALFALMLVAGCVPMHPVSPVVFRSAGAAIEAVYIDCDPLPVAGIELIWPADQEGGFVSEDDEVVWAITFDPPVVEQVFVLGDSTNATSETVPLNRDLLDGGRFALYLELSDGTRLLSVFFTEKLNSYVTDDFGYQSEEDYERTLDCEPYEHY